MRRLTFGSLFSGIGGFDLGLERAGLRCAWQVEIDPACRSVLDRHWPGVKRYEDVRDVGKRNLETVDVIVGGFPCQDLSVAGKREGLAGKRSGLWFEFYRVIDELHPRWAIVENVPGLLSSNSGQDFAVILRGLVELGYGVAWRVLDAQYFGVAQRRRRVFLVGSLGDGRAAQVLFESEGSTWDSAPGREAGQRTAGNTQRGFSDSGPGWWRDGIGTLRAEGENRPSRPSNLIAYMPEVSPSLLGDHHDGSEDGRNRRALVAVDLFNGTITGETAHTIQAGAEGHNYSPHTIPNVIAFTERTRADGRNFEAQEEIAYPLTDGSKGGTPHSSRITGGLGVRRLTPTECERLQGFPDGHTAGQSDSVRYRQLGNAVCVPVVEWLGKRLLGALETGY